MLTLNLLISVVLGLVGVEPLFLLLLIEVFFGCLLAWVAVLFGSYSVEVVI
jgi:hypothetical protein